MKYAALLLSGSLLSACASSSAAVANDAEPIYSQDFADARSLRDVSFSDVLAWEWGDGSLVLARPASYSPPFRSPLAFALIDDLVASDFVMEAELMQTGREYAHRDLCLFFGFESPERYYYAHLATTPDENAHNVFLVDSAPRRPLAPIAEKGVDWSDGWHRVRLEREGDAIRVFFDDMETPVLEAHDATIGAGQVGFGSFDDTGRFRNVRVWAR